MSARRLIPLLALGCALLAGCRHNRCHRDPPRPSCPPAGSLIPPAGIPDGPPPLSPTPRGFSPAPGSGFAPAPGNGGNGAELLLPQQIPPGKSRSEYPRPPAAPRRGAILGDPDYVEQPKILDAETPKDAGTAPAEKRSPGPDTLVGIAEFIQVKDGVSTGLRPTIDGLDWLKTQGYKTVVYLRRPGDDDTTDRRQVERRGMKFVSLEMSPEKLTKAWIDTFNETVGRSADRPVFVYSRETSAAAAVWYLHLRTAEFLTHDEARVRARRLGLKDEQSDMFQAALKVLPPNP
jgi:protein tyrosine phosphatase (PTP) superfamily phosphohydrolase (DUF442 family)